MVMRILQEVHNHPALSVGEIAAYVDAAFASIATAPEDKCFSRLIGRGGV